MLSTQLRLMATALIFYTRVPLPLWFEYSSDYLERASRYLPAVGLLVGGVGAVVFFVGDLFFSSGIALVLSIASTVALTGAFHEDGFADVCDGFGGGWTPERIMEIMKDPRLGSFGVIGISLLLLLKFLALQELPTALIPIALIAGHTVSRMVAISYIATHRYVREADQSKVKPLAETLTRGGLLIATATTAIPLLLSGSGAFWLALIPLVIVWWLMGKLFVKKLGGYTGDCLGAAQQVSEVVYYLAIGVALHVPT